LHDGPKLLILKSLAWVDLAILGQNPGNKGVIGKFLALKELALNWAACWTLPVAVRRGEHASML
jgi:hypothetical protein